MLFSERGFVQTDLMWTFGVIRTLSKHVLLDEYKLFDNTKMVQDLSPVSSGMWF